MDDAPDEREQEIERSLEAFDVDDQSLAKGRVGRVLRLLPVREVIALVRRVVHGVLGRVHSIPPLVQLTRRFRSRQLP